MSVSLGRLQQLVTVARCGSFSRAAEDLNISQPALSRSIAALERRYGVQIFNRIGHGVLPTAAGAQVIAQAEPLLQSMRVFESNLGLLASGVAGKLNLGLPPLLASQLLARVAADFFSPHAQAEIRVSIRSGPVLLEDLRNDAIELFFFAETQIEVPPEIETEPVGAIYPTLVARAGHPLASRRDLTLDDLSAFPWASSVEPPVMSGRLNPAHLLCDNYDVLRDVVLRTDMVCICTRDFVGEDLAEGRLCELHVLGMLPEASAIYAAKMRGRIASPLALAAIQRVRAHLAAPR